LEEVINSGSRAVLAKMPPGVLTKPRRFNRTEEAILYLKGKDPKELRRQREVDKLAREAVEEASAKMDEAETVLAAARQKAVAKVEMLMEAEVCVNAANDAVKIASDAVNVASTNMDAFEAVVAAAREEAITREETLLDAEASAKNADDATNSATAAFEAVKCEIDCEWMFGDVGLGLAGFRSAKLNPLRWSGRITIQVGIEQLQEVKEQAADRGIVVKVPGGLTGKEQHCKTPGEAMDFLEGVCSLRMNAREVLEAAKVEQKTASAQLSDAQEKTAVAREKLGSATGRAVRVGASLEAAKKKAAQAEEEQKTATTRLRDAEKDAAEAGDKLGSATPGALRAGAILEVAKKREAEAKATLDVLIAMVGRTSISSESNELSNA